MKLRRSFRLEHIFIAVLALVLLYQLFREPMVGLANSGDFGRVMSTVGLTYRSGDLPGYIDLFVVKKFVWEPTLSPHYPTTELAFLGTALLGDAAMSRDGLFDIRALGLVYAVCFLGACLVLTKWTRGLSLGNRALIYSLVLLFFTDVGCTAYYNSLFSEPASLVSLAAVVAFALGAVASEEPSRRRWFWIGGYVLATTVFVMAKVQNAFLGFPLAYVGYRVCAGLSEDTSGQNPGMRKRAFVVALLITIVSVGYFAVYSIATKETRFCNLYCNVFTEILPHSDSPAEDAVALGLDPSAAHYAGTTAYSLEPSREVKDSLIAQTSLGRVVEFYITHPRRLADLSGRAAEKTFSMRPKYLGNFERDVVLSRSVEVERFTDLPSDYFSESFAYWSSFKDIVVPKSVWFVAGFILANLVALLAKSRRFDATARDRMVSEFHGVLVLMATMQFFTVIVGEGEYEIVKHFFLFNVLCEVCWIFMVVYIVNGLLGLRRRKHAALMEMVA